jgi:hypothetical protein
MTRRERSAPLLLALLGLGLLGCVQGSIWVTPTPVPPELPVPDPLEGEAPELRPTPIEGLLVAPGAVDPLYFEKESELWFRYWRRRWYQAFGWDGHWFSPEHVPPALRRGPLGEQAEARGEEEP